MPIYKAEPSAPTRQGNSVRTHLSEALVELADLENRVASNCASEELSALKSKIQDRIDVLNSARQTASAGGDHESVYVFKQAIKELSNLLGERG